MYYIDKTRYDQVDGTDPVLPGVLVNGTTGLILSPARDDGARYLVPSFLPGTWSRYGPSAVVQLCRCLAV